MIGVIVAFFSTTIGRIALGAVGGLFMLGGAYVKGNNHGHRTERQKWEYAMLKEQKRQQDAIAKASAEAAQDKQKSEAELEALQKQVDDYEAELAKRPAPAQCVLDKHDAERLRRIK